MPAIKISKSYKILKKLDISFIKHQLYPTRKFVLPLFAFDFRIQAISKKTARPGKNTRAFEQGRNKTETSRKNIAV